MIKTYRYTIQGTAAGGQTWETSGIVSSEYDDVFTAANHAAFLQLTEGKAVFGKPGVGCHGPYDILTITIEPVKLA